MLCKGTHGKDTLEAVENLLIVLCAELGHRVKDSHTPGGEVLDDEVWTAHLVDVNVDNLDMDNVGMEATNVDASTHDDDDAYKSCTGAMRAPSVVSACSDDGMSGSSTGATRAASIISSPENDIDDRSSTGATRAPSVASSSATARWPPQPYIEDDSTSTISESRDAPGLSRKSGSVPHRGTIDQEPIILDVERSWLSEMLKIRETLPSLGGTRAHMSDR